MRLVLLCAVVLVACSGEPAEPLTRAEFVARADDLCSAAAERWETLEPPAQSQPVTEEGFAELMAWDLTQGHAFGSDVLAQVRDLRPPPSLEPRVETMLDALEEDLELMDSYAAAVAEADEEQLAELDEQAGDDAGETYRRAAEKLGLDACAEGLFLSSWRAGSAPSREGGGL